jgi:hypothetical protein
MIYVLSSLIVFLVGVVIFLALRLVKAGEQLLLLDDVSSQAVQDLEKAEIILKHAHEALLKVSKHPVVSNDLIVTHLISVINIAKNEIQSILDDLINSNKE